MIDLTTIMQLQLNMRLMDNRQRKGQAMFNAAYALYPNEADKLRGTEYDCFYADERIGEFLLAMQKFNYNK